MIKESEGTDRKDPDEEDFDPKKNLIRLSVSLVLLYLFLVVLRFTLGDQMEFIGEELVHRFGYPGVFIATLFLDTFITLISPDIILFVSIAGGMNTFWALATVSLASIIGGNIGYLIGKFLGHREMVLKRIGPYEKRGKFLMKRYGLWAVIIGAMTPIPFSAVCWIAGMLGMKYSHFMAGVIWRIPRFLLWYIVLSLGFKGITW